MKVFGYIWYLTGEQDSWELSAGNSPNTVKYLSFTSRVYCLVSYSRV